MHPHKDEYAVIDLGSNSFHLHVVRVVDGDPRYVDRYRDVVRIGDGLRSNGNIRKAKQEEALEVIARYGERIHEFHPGNVHAIGTSAFRHARKATRFIEKAEKKLGFPIDIVSGEEEAKLIYLGIQMTDQPKQKRLFIVDIGGGSTEFIYGEGRQPTAIESVEYGNISLSRTIFRGRELTEDLFSSTCNDIADVFRSTDIYKYRDRAQMVLGASGTLRLTETVLRNLGYSDNGITKKALASLISLYVQRGRHKDILKAGLPEERLETFPGALALLCAIFNAFQFKNIAITQAGVRQGILHDMLLLPPGEDRKKRALTNVMERYRVDKAQANRVHQFVERHLRDVLPAVTMNKGDVQDLLYWASMLHEIGMTVNYSGYHKHGAYLISNADLAGFSRLERMRLAFLVLNHRKRIKLDHSDIRDGVELPLLLLIRLARLFNRKRKDVPDPVQKIRIDGDIYTLSLEKDWIHDHPLAAAQIAREQVRWSDIGVTLALDEE